jgi:hypothetical protein
MDASEKIKDSERPDLHAPRAKELRQKRISDLRRMACALGLNVEALLKLDVNPKRPIRAK